VKLNKRQREILIQLTNGHVLRRASGNYGKDSYAILDMTKEQGKTPGVFVSNVTEPCFQKIRNNNWIELKNLGSGWWDYAITQSGREALN
jgi:hypothetical protein